MIMRGAAAPDTEGGWDAFHAISREVESGAGADDHVKLVSPQPRVLRTLDASGFSQLLEIYQDLDGAVASF
jgi:hypothetical protein